MKVLLLLGGGVGNFVHATSAIEAIRRTGHDLTVWAGGEWDGQTRLLDAPKVVTGPIPDLATFERVFRTPFALTGSDAHLAAEYGGRAEPTAMPPGPQTAEVDANMWFARVLGYDGPTPTPRVRFLHKSQVSGEYAVIAPGVQFGAAVWLKKGYPHWGEVAQKLFEKCIRTVFVGHARDSRPEFAAHVDMCGRTTLWEATGVLHGARVVAAVDNGLSCLSAVMGKPTVVLWGPTDVVKNRKYGRRVIDILSPLPCRPCQYTEALLNCTHANCIRAINPAVVADAIVAEWERKET